MIGLLLAVGVSLALAPTPPVYFETAQQVHQPGGFLDDGWVCVRVGPNVYACHWPT